MVNSIFLAYIYKALRRWLRLLNYQGLTLTGQRASGAIAEWLFLVLRQTSDPDLREYQQMLFLGYGTVFP